MAKPKTLSFTYNGKDYTLEYDRNSAAIADESFKELESLETNPEKALVIIPKLWRCAFIKHHSDLSTEEIDEIYEKIEGKDEALIVALVELYAEPLMTLFKNEGNVKWTKSW